MKPIYAIGNSEAVMLFQSIGIESFIVTNNNEFKNKLEELKGAKIILISESLSPFLEEISYKYANETYPILLLLPMEGHESSLGLDKLKKDVEKAIGIALLR